MNIAVIARGARFAFLSTLVCVFFTSSQAQTFTVIHNFSGGADGANPYAGITIDGAGNLLGTASAGALGYGTVFKLKPSQSGYTLGVLYSFTGGSDGAYPYNGVVVGSDGIVYGSTYSAGGGGCGGYGCGNVFNLKPPATFCRSVSCPWTETSLHGFVGGTDGSGPTQGTNLIFDQMGNIYGTTVSGGAYGQGTVYKLTRSGSGWTESVIHTFGASGDGAQPLHNVILDTSGNLYGTTSYGGANNNGAVYQLVPSGSGWTENILVSFSLSGSAGGVPYAGLLIDRVGQSLWSDICKCIGRRATNWIWWRGSRIRVDLLQAAVGYSRFYTTFPILAKVIIVARTAILLWTPQAISTALPIVMDLTATDRSLS